MGVELLVEGRVVRASAASEAWDPKRALYPRTFDVAQFAGCKARLRVNDQSPTGAVAVGRFIASDLASGVPCDATALLCESHRPQFHFTTPTGWQNDANGLLYYRGQWHLFHQHRPPGSPAIVWGHAVSGDLLRWQQLSTAIACDGGDSAFSGSGLVDGGNASGLQRGADSPVLLFYTRHPPVNSGRKATQCLAISTDGATTFEQFTGNPILRTADATDRDPKAFFYQPTREWFMVLSLAQNNTARERATYGLYRSRDLKAWELVQEIGPGAWYWECPDFIELPVDGDPHRTKWLLIKGSGDYLVGRFDGNRFTPECEPIRVNWGASYYGAQTFSDAPGGRRVQIGWMPSGKEKAPNAWPGMPFNQQMSFPCELTLRTTADGPRLVRRPIAEISQLYATTRELKPGPLAPGDNPLAGVHHDLLDIELDVELGLAAQLALNVRGEEIRYVTQTRRLHAFGRSLAWEPRQGRLVLRVLIDRTSIELFGNDGERTHSGLFFADPANKNLSLSVLGGTAQVRRIAVREVRSACDRHASR